MAARIFALIVGIDQYKSSDIWNLQSCVDDAQNIKRWLMNDLNVPRDQICLLLDDKATKRNIEDRFMSHLVNNPAIEPDDAILIYFACHGSNFVAPDNWCNNKSSLHVEILCTHDHGTKTKEGRVSGITDWSLHAMIAELAEVKGNNITLILDSCFSPPRGRNSSHGKHSTRWTRTTKVTSDDLYAGLWRDALSRKMPESGQGFHLKTPSTHVTLLACSPGEQAVEDKEGGRFTVALLEAKDAVPLHRTSYAQLVSRLAAKGDMQHAVCLGQNRKRILFGGAPFVTDPRFVPAARLGQDVRVDAGAIHGVVEGTEFTMHEHNCRGSLNPVLATLSAVEVHPTWCRARGKYSPKGLMQSGWARITRWNNRTPFRVHLKKTCTSFMQWWRLQRKLKETMHAGISSGGLNITRVRKASQADISVQKLGRQLAIERHDALIARNCPRIIYVPNKESSDDMHAIDAAARFHLHLHRKNSLGPLRDKVSMGLYRLDDESWSTVGDSVIVDGKATITHEKGSIYSVSLENKSNMDLWPYLFWMDASGYVISSIYQPNPSSLSPPLLSHSSLMIGNGTVGSEALSFHLNEDESYSSGFLKLFVSTEYVPMSIVEQGSVAAATDVSRDSLTTVGVDDMKISHMDDHAKEIWDSIITCVTIVRGN